MSEMTPLLIFISNKNSEKCCNLNPSFTKCYNDNIKSHISLLEIK